MVSLSGITVSGREGTGAVKYRFRFFSAALILFFVSTLLLCSCSGSSDSSPEASDSAGAIAFSIMLSPESTSDQPRYKAALLDCDALGIVSVEADVFDETDTLIAEGGPWECSLGEGTIYGVKQGNNRTVLIFLKDSENIVRYKGEKTEITVIGGRTTDAGVIIVVEAEEDNLPPAATDDAARGVRGGRIEALENGFSSVLNNDSDPDGDPLTVSSVPVVSPEHGTLVLNSDGT
ncbi:MAG: Ig-like domain-containing protein, partial [Desulfomonilia bacterium]